MCSKSPGDGDGKSALPPLPVEPTTTTTTNACCSNPNENLPTKTFLKPPQSDVPSNLGSTGGLHSLASLASSATSLSSDTSISSRQQKLPSNTFYKRALPSTCTPFNSPKGRSLFAEALAEGYMETYFSLSLQFLTQAEPAYCGLSTLCMVLNALEIDPGRQWKGVWRWYDESMLDCCRPLEEVMKVGITLPEFVCLARCNGLKAKLRRHDRSTKEQFLEDLKMTSRAPQEYLVVSYDRGTLQQTGTGHFSPVGGDSFKPVDPSTGKPRGYVILKRGKRSYVQSALSQLAVNRESWPRLSNILFKELPKRFSSQPPSSPAHFIQSVIDAIPEEYDSVVENRMPLFVTPVVADDGCGGQQILNGVVGGAPSDTASACGGGELPPVFDAYVAGLDDLLHKLADTGLYKLVTASLEARRTRRKHESVMNMAATASAKAAASLATEEGKSTLPSAAMSPSSSSSPRSLALNGMGFRDRSRDLLPLNTLSHQISSPPMSPRYAVFHAQQQQASTTPELAAIPSLDSFSDLHPPNHEVNDFAAFLTMFLFALFQYKPLHEDLPDVDFDGDYGLSDDFGTGVLDVNLRREVAFLKDQIAALTELQVHDKRSDATLSVPTPTGTASSTTPSSVGGSDDSLRVLPVDPLSSSKPPSTGDVLTSNVVPSDDGPDSSDENSSASTAGDHLEI
ncbi:Phytochelatin synthase-domain-containing protein [Phlyctochytrium arcticum]|nr:Phytochelatin synthase-domain-containing protein [Phlyctochytrium arcticum]